jgi:nucleotide-binding universal stress UspA family protein
MKNILLLVHDDEGQEARFQAALDVTRTLGGHLNCLDVSVLPVIAGDMWVADGTAMLLQEERTREAANRQALEARLSRDDVPWTWVDVTGELAPCIERAANLNDLIIINRRLDGSWPDMRGVASELIVRAGKPIFAVPGDATGVDLTGHAMVAWDGSAAAGAALAAAVPMLDKASVVTILEVVDGKKQAVPTADAASYLSRHGIYPRIMRELAGRLSVEDVILREVRERKIDYLVMGGFGHGRVTEALFGGVTRKMLSASPVPLLIAH